MKNAKYFFVALLPAFIMLILQFAVMYALMVAATVAAAVSGKTDVETMDIFISELITGPDFTSLFMLSFELVAVLGFGLFFIITGKKNRESSIEEIPFGVLPKGLLLFAGAELLTSCGLLLLAQLAPDLMESYSDSIAATLGDMNWKTMLASLLLAPIAEEFIFRGLTLRYALKSTKNFWIANIIQAALFGFVHLNLVQGTYAFILGMLLGFTRRRYDSLFASIWGHVVFNFTGTVIVGLVFGVEPANEVLYVIMIAVLSVLLLAGALFWILRDEKSKQYSDRFDENHRLAYASVNAVPVLPVINENTDNMQ